MSPPSGCRFRTRCSFAMAQCAEVSPPLLAIDADDYFVLKPKHSAFFATPLDTLLAYLGAKTLILTGLTADSCVLFTAGGAFMRDLHLEPERERPRAA